MGQQALDLINILTNKSFLSSLCFILDIQEIFRTHSLFYQKKEETIIGQSDRREKFVADLKKFQREGEGRWLNHLLRITKCQPTLIIGDHTRNGGDVRPCNDLASYERYDV